MRLMLISFCVFLVTAQSFAQPGGSKMESIGIDHNDFDALLKGYVDEDGFVDYPALKAHDALALDEYLEKLGSVDPSLYGRSERLAFWINAYNALTIKGILHFYPTKSIRDHVSVFGYSIWKDYKTNVNGAEDSLDDMEHKILRKMDEPRIHFAIVCASVGCPKLLNEAYTAANLDEQLTRSTRDFFSDRGKFMLDAEKGVVYQSPIMDWYKDDFGSNQETRLAFIRPFLESSEDRAILDRDRLKVKNLDYDWNLNDQSQRATNVTKKE